MDVKCTWIPTWHQTEEELQPHFWGAGVNKVYVRKTSFFWCSRQETYIMCHPHLKHDSILCVYPLRMLTPIDLLYFIIYA